MLSDEEATEEAGKSMLEVKQRMKEKLHAGTSAAAADDTLPETELSGVEDETQPATARSVTTPPGNVVLLFVTTGMKFICIII